MRSHGSQFGGPLRPQSRYALPLATLEATSAFAAGVP